MKKRTKIIAASTAVLVAAAGLIGATAINSNDNTAAPEVEAAPSKILVDTANPTIGSIVVTGEYIGTVEPNQQVMVFPKLAGEVLLANYTVGDTVEAGAVLAKIDAKTLEYTIAQTQATLNNAAAKAELNIEVAEFGDEFYNRNLDDGYILMQAESTFEAAKLSLEIAQVDLRNARRNLRDGTRGVEVTENPSLAQMNNDQLRSAVSKAEIALESAQQQYELAEKALQAARVGVESDQFSNDVNKRMAELNADFSDQYIALAKLQNDLGNATITAPISGVIEQKNIDQYDMASSSSPAYVISNKDIMTVSFQVAETAYYHVRTGDTVTIEKNGQTCTGVITEVATMANASTGLFTVKASIENAPFDLLSGTSVKIHADTQKAENTIVLPLDAVYYDNNVPYVFVADNGVARRVDVTTGVYDAKTVEILSGITLNDKVIVTWHSGLEDGAQLDEGGDAAREEGDDNQ